MGPPWQVAGSTRVAAVIGHPIRHSISPVIHNAAFRALDLDWVFTAFEVAPGRAAAAAEGARDLRLAGLSVTMPHKADVGRALDRRTPPAEVLGAGKTVVRRGRPAGHRPRVPPRAGPRRGGGSAAGGGGGERAGHAHRPGGPRLPAVEGRGPAPRGHVGGGAGRSGSAGLN